MGDSIVSNLITLDQSEDLKQVEPSKAKQIKATFQPMVEMLEGFEETYNSIILESEQGIDEDIMKRAKRLRLDIVQVRIQAEKARKEMKEEYLRASKAIDGTNNILKWAVQDKEAKLKEIEEHFDRLAAEELARLQAERVELLSPYVEDAEERDLASMDVDVWEAYLSTKKQAYEDRLEAERKAEEARKEAERIQKLTQCRKEQLLPYWSFFDASKVNELGELSDKDFNYVLSDVKAKKKKHDEEQEAIRRENERLKKEREEEAKRQAKIEAERKAKEEEARKKAEEERKKKEAELEAERKRVADLEAKEKARKEAEQKAKEEAERLAKEAALAPEKERLAAWIDSFELPELAGAENATSKEVRAKFESFKSWAQQQVKNMEMEVAA